MDLVMAKFVSTLEESIDKIEGASLPSEKYYPLDKPVEH